ncbi:hypothetical protein BHM03_00033473 [Ensete ventricosum]|nr:hypothetical protein BHM03_00033473 [Ensete ventricosum]
MITWDHRIETHHRPITTIDVRPQEQNALTTRARGSLMRSYKSGPRDMELLANLDLTLEITLSLKSARVLTTSLDGKRATRQDNLSNTSRVGIGIALTQDDQLLVRIEDFPTFYMRCLKEILVATKLKVWLDTDP